MGYDKYFSAVVRAQSAEHARHIHPNPNEEMIIACFKDSSRPYVDHTWVMPKDVTVTYLGPSLPGQTPGVVCANFYNG